MLNALFVTLAPLLLSLNLKTNFESLPVPRATEKYAGYIDYATFLGNNLADSIAAYNYAHLNPGMTISLFPNTLLAEGDGGRDDDGFGVEETWIA